MPLDTALRKQIENRLRREGRYQTYLHARRFLTNSGIPLRDAWRVIAMGFDPIDGSEPEIMGDKRYAEIRTKIGRGDYPQPPDFPKFPSGLIDFRQPVELNEEQKQFVEEVKQAPRKFTNRFEKIAAGLDPSVYAPEFEQVRWAMNHCYTDVENLDPATVPSTGALKILEVLQSGGRDAMEVIKLYLTKAMPDRKAIEDAARYSDDGRLLTMLDEFDQSCEEEWQTDEESDAVTETEAA